MLQKQTLMYQLIDFCQNEPIRQTTKMGEPPDVAVFKDKLEARIFAESRGYEMIIEDRFLLAKPRGIKQPVYIKIVEIVK